MSNIARRYSTGKLRMELVPTRPRRFVAEVYTRGAHKYSIYEDETGKRILGTEISYEDAIAKKLKLIEDGANNWRKGLSWMSTYGAVQRHLHDWVDGIDIDQDPAMRTRNLANAIWGLEALLEYSLTHPELDDRPHKYLKPERRIGLDIDGVLADFSKYIQVYLKRDKIEDAVHWNNPYIRENFKHISKDPKFWSEIPALLKPEDIPFEPAAYITARSIDTAVTQEWLDRNGFPRATVISLPPDASKLDAARKLKIDVFVDDKFETFVELNKGGILTYLMDAPYNRRHNVGHKRIFSLKDLSHV